MLKKAFPIDFVRQVLEQTLMEEHFDNPLKYFGGKEQVNLFSFYEQLQKEDEVNRYVKIYRDLVKQQNRSGIIMNGTIVAPENPTITNLWDSLIIPLTFTCAFRVKLADRDLAINTINNLIEVLKGKKYDIVELESGKLIKVGTIANDNRNSIRINSRDFIGKRENSSTSIATFLHTTLDNLSSLGVSRTSISNNLYYFEDYDNHLKAVKVKSYSGSLQTITYDLLNENTASEEGIYYIDEVISSKYKLSLSFDSIRCDEPYNLNADKYIVIYFGGSATLTDINTVLGNDLIKVGLIKKEIKAKIGIEITSVAQDKLSNATILEPLEMPSGANADTQISQLLSNKFITNSHSDNLSISNQYTFVLDRSIPILDQWFKYTRYGIVANGEDKSYQNYVSPNIIYHIFEVWCSFGNFEVIDYHAKIVESIDIENTESDILTLTIPFQVQGEN